MILDTGIVEHNAEVEIERDVILDCTGLRDLSWASCTLPGPFQLPSSSAWPRPAPVGRLASGRRTRHFSLPGTELCFGSLLSTSGEWERERQRGREGAELRRRASFVPSRSGARLRWRGESTREARAWADVLTQHCAFEGLESLPCFAVIRCQIRGGLRQRVAHLQKFNF